jgi:hypothetical protein
MKKIIFSVILLVCLVLGSLLFFQSLDRRADIATSEKAKNHLDHQTPSKDDISRTSIAPSENSGKHTENPPIETFQDEVIKLFERDYKTIKVTFTKDSDPSKQIQKALNLAKKAQQPIKVVIPKGTYIVKDALHIYSNTWLHLSSDTILRKSDTHDDLMLLNGDVNASYHNYDGNSNIIVDGGTWDAVGKSSKQRTPAAFGFAHGKNIIIQNTIVKNVYAGHAIDSSGNKNVIIRNNQFLGARKGNVYTEAIQIDGMVSDKAFRRFGSVDLTITTNMIVENNYFGDSGAKDMRPWGVGVGSHSAAHKKPYSNISIINNTFERMTYAAIRGHNWENVFIKENYFYDCAQGIQIDSLGKYYFLTKGEHHQGNGNLVIASIQINGNHFIGRKDSSIILVGDSKDFRGEIITTSNSYKELNLTQK